jgi:hypothetical protein
MYRENQRIGEFSWHVHLHFFHLKGLLLCHVWLTCCCGFLRPFFRFGVVLLPIQLSFFWCNRTEFRLLFWSDVARIFVNKDFGMCIGENDFVCVLVTFNN